jgi:glycosyltransferase involved in cell wall biosynthesis
MRIAYFSPLNPQKSGISDYSETLIPSLAKHCDIDLWVSDINITNKHLKNHKIIDYIKNKTSINKLADYDAIIYNIGNNPHFHASIYDVLLKYPGFVIQHDYVLYYLITGYYLDYLGERENYIREFYYNYNQEGICAVKEILRDRTPPLQFRCPERYPLVKRIIEAAQGIIVHSETTRNSLIQQGASASKIKKIDHINFYNEKQIPGLSEVIDLRAKYGVTEEDTLVASFGYIAPTKRNLEIVKAIKFISLSGNYKIKYLMVGDGQYIDGLLNDNIKKTGFTPLGEFEKLLYCSDIIVNLRYPSMGETSGTLIRALTAGKPCIVTDDAWFSELPDNAVIKIPFGAKEMPSLIEALILLMESADERKIIGKNARDYALKYHDPSKISSEIYHFIKDCPRQKGTISECYNRLNNQRLKEIGVASKCGLLQDVYRKLNYDKIDDLGLKPIKNSK